MKKLKSVVSVSMSAILSLGIFGSATCLTGSGASKSASAPTTITAYFLAPKCKDLSKIQDAVNKILIKNDNIKVNLIYYDWDSYQDKMKLALQANNAGDVMFTAGWNNFSTFVGGKAFASLDTLLSKYGKDIKKNINPTYLKGVRIDGNLYSIPTNKDMASEWGVVINKRLATKYKMDFSTVKKPEDLEKYLKVIKEKEPGIIPFLGDTTASVMSAAYDYYYTGDASTVGMPRSKSTKILNILDDSRVQNLIKLSRSWYQKGYYNSDIGTIKSISDYQKNQKAFMWTEQLKPGKDTEMTNTEGYAMIQCDYYPSLKPSCTTNELNNSMLSIPQGSKNKEAAMKFINELFKSDGKVQNLLAWGISGTNYSMVKGTTNKIQFPTGVTSTTSGYTGIYQWAMGGNQLSDYLWTNESSNKWTKMNAWNKSATVSGLVGYNFDTSKLQNQLAAIKNVDNKYWPAIYTGTVDYSSVKSAYRAAQTTAGIKTVISTYQSQITAFLKKNK